MVGSRSHACQTAKIMDKLEGVVLRERPDNIVVLGDVNSTLAGALVAAKLNIPVAHIEAGLRSYNKIMPEEINRLLTDHISRFLFCPTDNAVRNLTKEGIEKGVYNVGDIMYDNLINSESKIRNSKLLDKLKLKPRQYLLLTVHRAANTDDLANLRGIITAIGKSGEKVIFPIHPRTKKQLKKIKLPKFDNLEVIKPVNYLDMLVLEKNARKILTDSGGVQKEAYWLKVPCITLRNETEWVETIKSGWNILVGANEDKILKAIRKFDPRGKRKKYFGRGNTAKRIVKFLNEK
jgi:UDP-N-acetylglucosamine 2-epimerase (non-hydrolysing)